MAGLLHTHFFVSTACLGVSPALPLLLWVLKRAISGWWGLVGALWCVTGIWSPFLGRIWCSSWWLLFPHSKINLGPFLCLLTCF